MTTVYENAPLAFGTNTNIRLIQLLPSSETRVGQRQEVKCKFHILPLTQKVSYTAISYMWGQDDATVDIELDGARFAVRPNLFQLLLTLSRSESCPDLLWVDALCIDQNNESERTHQVRLMGQIYSQAAGVIVWLGHRNPDVSQAMEYIRNTSNIDKQSHLERIESLDQHFEFFKKLWWKSHRCPDSGMDVPPGFNEGYIWLLTSTVLNELRYSETEWTMLPPYRPLYPPTIKDWAQLKCVSWSLSTYRPVANSSYKSDPMCHMLAEYFCTTECARKLLTLCTHPYWSRVWIVQEIFLAKNVCIQYGGSRLDNIDELYSRIQSISTWLKPGASIGSRDTRKYLSAIPDSPAARLLAKRRMWQTPGSRKFITPWDSGFGTLGCADVRDRVYAMSALMDPMFAIVPDYSKSAAELFESIFEEHLKRNSTFSGPIWNLQSMLELDDKIPIIQRAKQHGSPEWLSTGTLAAHGRIMAINDIDRSSSASRAYQGPDDDALARMRAEWSEQTRRRRAAKITRARASNDGQ